MGAALEGFDDDHGSAATGARISEGLRFSVIVGHTGVGRRHGEKPAGAG